MNLIDELEAKVGNRKIIACPKYCDGGVRGMDRCNYCDACGSGFRMNGEFYPNTEDGWRSALACVSASPQAVE